MTHPRLLHAELTSERVRLVPLALEHAKTAYAMLHGNEDILRWLVWEGPERLVDLEDFYCRWILETDHGDDYHFAVLERETGDFAGCIGPRFAGHPATGDVGYWLAPDYWGLGLMTEAVGLVNYLAFRYLDAQVMSAYVFVGNHGSRQVLERNGYSLIHTAKEKVVKRGKPIDEWYFTLLRHEYEERGERRPLEERVDLV